MPQAPRSGTVHVETRAAGPETIFTLITLDYPPLNIGSQAMRADLARAIAGLRDTPDLLGIVLRGANGNFVAGSDIREFDAPPRPPHLPDIIAALEAFPKPVVAAIEGTALGGGFELALGCDARVAAPGAVIGLPEVSLGLIPGAGGTQRVPRLTGQARAIDLITSGRRLGAAEALSSGLVDAVAGEDLIDGAVAYLRRLAGAKRVLTALPVPPDSPEAVAGAEQEALRRARGKDAVAEAIAAIRDAGTQPPDAGLAAERERSLRLRKGPQCKALRHLFLAERAALKGPAEGRRQPLETVGVVGAGRMGQGIALALAGAGLTVRLAERDEDALAAGIEALSQTAHDLAVRGRIPAAGALTARIHGGPLEAMADCDLIVEAILEDMGAKTTLFTRLDALVRPDAILATNTSYLDIDRIAAATARPERVAGLHFFNPAHVMRLVEVIRAARTTPDAVASLVALCRRLGKIPLIAGVGEGFIGNRIFSAYRRHCEFLLEEGCQPNDVDRAMRAFGMAMGPFAVFDLAGLDIAWATRKRLAPTRDPRTRYVDIPDRLCERGRFGRKTGKGWYDYTSDPKGIPDHEVRALIEEAVREKARPQVPLSDDAIRNRLLAAMVNEAALVLEDGIAGRAADIDLVMVHGYGFPALTGGPLHWAAHQPHDAILEAVTAMAEAEGHGARIAPSLPALLDAAAV